MNNPPDSLTDSLHRWRVNPPVDPNFRQKVWQRIGERTRATWPAYLHAHLAAWALVAMLALGAAAYTGHSTARARVRADRESLVVSYLVDLDPRVQAVRRPSVP